jgi:hypothetical protein
MHLHWIKPSNHYKQRNQFVFTLSNHRFSLVLTKLSVVYTSRNKRRKMAEDTLTVHSIEILGTGPASTTKIYKEHSTLGWVKRFENDIFIWKNEIISKLTSVAFQCWNWQKRNHFCRHPRTVPCKGILNFNLTNYMH